MILEFAVFAATLAAGLIIAGLIADRTEIGAGLAAAVKGHPYEPIKEAR